MDAIEGLGPAIAAGHNLLNRNPNSTLATASGLHPCLRLIYARYGERRYARCGAALQVLSEDEIVERTTCEVRRASSGDAPVSLLASLVQRARH